MIIIERFKTPVYPPKDFGVLISFSNGIICEYQCIEKNILIQLNQSTYHSNRLQRKQDRTEKKRKFFDRTIRMFSLQT